MFVVIEGIDGSGKGTQTKLLKTKMEGLGYEVKYCYTGDVKDKYENDFLFQSRVASLYSSLVSKTTRCHNWHQIKTEHENGSLKDEKEITEEFILPLFSNGF